MDSIRNVLRFCRNVLRVCRLLKSEMENLPTYNQLLETLSHDLNQLSRLIQLGEHLKVYKQKNKELQEQADFITEICDYYDKAHHYPGLLINTLPKSGSVYITHFLARNLQLPILNKVAHGYFPYYYLIPNALDHLLLGNRIAQEHFDANPVNIHWLKKLDIPFVLHVRDPRQATLSWVHHYNQCIREGANNYTVHITPPVDYLNLPLERQIDWHIDTHLVSVTLWLKQWMHALQKEKLNVLVTYYRDLQNDEKSFFDRILKFYHISGKFSDAPNPQKDQNLHFRKGLLDEWKTVFTEQQVERCDRIIGEEIFDFFGWKNEVSIS